MAQTQTLIANRLSSHASLPAHRTALGMASLALLAVAAYASTPFNFWVGDDYNFVLPKELDQVLSLFDPTVPTRAFYRPFYWTSFVIDYDLWGRVPFGWHITNILIHVANTLVVALIVRKLVGSWGLSVLAGALFALHPSHPEAVAWVNGRVDAVCALFYFPAVLFFVIYLGRRAEGRTAGGYYALSLLMMCGAILAKEPGITIPPLLLLTDFLFFTPAGKLRGFAYWRGRILPYLPFFALMSAYVAMRYYLVATGIVKNVYTAAIIVSPRRLLEAATGYILLAVGVPGGAQVGQELPDLLKVASLVAAALTAVLLVRWLGRPALYGLLWTGVTLALTYNLATARWFYIPSFGICLLVALILGRLSGFWFSTLPRLVPKSKIQNPKLAYALAIAVMLAWGLSVIYQNIMWHLAGEEARSILSQVRALAPNPVRPTTMYFAGVPYSYGPVFLFNTGLSNAMRYEYQEYGLIEVHDIAQPFPDPVIQGALASPPKIRPNALFMGFHNGKVYKYPTFDELLKAGINKE